MLNIKTKIDDLTSRQGFMRYFKNTSWLMGERILRMAVGLFVGIWVARYLGPEQFGLFSYAQSFVGLFTVIAGLGLDGIVVRELVRDPAKQAVLLGTAFRLKIIGALLVIVVLAIAMWLTNQDGLTALLVFIIASATVFQSFNVIDFFFQANVLSKYVVFVNMASLFTSSVAKVILILNDAALTAFAVVVLFDSFVLMFGLVYFFQKKSKISFKTLRFSKPVAVDLLRNSWPLILSGVAISIALRIDQVMIKNYLDLSHVGLYSSGVRLAEAFLFIPMVVAQSIFPKIIEMDIERGRKFLVLLVRRVFYVLVVLSIIVNNTSEFVVVSLFGHDFLGGHVVLDVLIWTIPFTHLGIMTNKLHLKNHEQKTIFIKQLTLTIFNVLLNISLIPVFGLVGAALATLLTDIVINLFFDFIVKRNRWIFFLKLEALFFIKVRLS